MRVFGVTQEERELLSEVKDLKRSIEDLKAETAVKRRELELMDTVNSLKRQISDLEISKSKKQEDFDKQERELRHMIGLEKKRQEFEIESSKRETMVTLREENLKADRLRFEEQLKFHEDRFSKEVGYLKEIMQSVLERLPNISAEFSHTERRK